MRNKAGDFRSFGAVWFYFLGYVLLGFALMYNFALIILPFLGDNPVQWVLMGVFTGIVWNLIDYWVFRSLGEVARLLCIPVAGWRFVSFRFGQGGVRCLLDPPSPVNGECPCVCYLLCGGGSNLLLGILLVGIGFFTPIGNYLRVFGFLALCCAWQRLYPRCFRDVGNDGYWLLRIRKDPKQSAVLRLLQKLTVEMSRAETYADFSEETVNALMEYECGDFGYGDEVVPLYYRAHYLFAQGDRAGAAAVYRMIAESAAPEMLKGRAYCELLYAAIFDGTPKEELFVLQERVANLRKNVKDNTSRRRLMVAVRLVCEKDKARAEEEYQALLRLCKTAPFRAQAALDLREAKRVWELYGSKPGAEVTS